MSEYRTFSVRSCERCEFDEGLMVLAELWEPDGKDHEDGEERYYWTRHAVHMAMLLYGRAIERRFSRGAEE